MTDNETMTNETVDDIPDSEPAPAPEPEPEPAPEPEPVPEPEDVTQTELPSDSQQGQDVLQPEPQEPSAPVEVITVDDLLDRLTGTGQEEEEAEETEEPPPEDEEETGGGGGGGSIGEDSEAAAPVQTDQILEYLEIIQQTEDHPLLDTSFVDYTVTEGLLLFLALSVVVSVCLKMLKGGFAWLR